MIGRSEFITEIGVALVASQLPVRRYLGPRPAVARYLDIFATRDDFFGVVALRRGSEVQEHRVGFSDYRKRDPDSKCTTFLVGSISKHFTSVAILLLAREKRLRVHDDITRHLPELTQFRGVTLEQIMLHTGGLPRDFHQGAVQISPEGAVRAAAGMMLVGQPGATYAYSNVGYALLSAIVERASSTPFNDYVKVRILEPAGMTHSGIVGRIQPPGLPTGYIPGVGRSLLPMPNAWREAIPGAGSIYSTIGDMLRWDYALWNHVILSKSELAQLVQPRAGHYGYGIANGVRHTHRFVGHDGRMTGFVARYDHFPNDGATQIVLGNVDTGAVFPLAEGLTRLLFGQEAPKVDLPVLLDGSISKAAASRYVGTYEITPSSSFDIVFRNGTLCIPGNGGHLAALSPALGGGFFYRELYARLCFPRSGDPPAEVAWTDITGKTYRCMRKA